jgi:hypothetical protein
MKLLLKLTFVDTPHDAAAKEAPLYVNPLHITAMYRTSGSTHLVGIGVAYRVRETPEEIEQMAVALTAQVPETPPD